MARVTVTVDGILIREHVLSKERTTIGRKAHNDIQIEDNFLSGEHAAILREGEDWIIEDLRSRNGMLLNGRRTGRQRLKPDDRIDLGDYRLVFRTDSEDKAGQFLVSRLLKTRPMKFMS